MLTLGPAPLKPATLGNTSPRRGRAASGMSECALRVPESHRLPPRTVRQKRASRTPLLGYPAKASWLSNTASGTSP